MHLFLVGSISKHGVGVCIINSVKHYCLVIIGLSKIILLVFFRLWMMRRMKRTVEYYSHEGEHLFSPILIHYNLRMRVANARNLK